MLTNFPYDCFKKHNLFLQTASDVLIDANTEYCNQLVIAKEATAIRYIHVYFVTVANAGDVRVSLQGINDTALPSVANSTILGAGNSAYGTATISAAGWYRVQLNTDYTPAVGDMFFVCIEPTNFQAGDSYTVGGQAERLSVQNVYRHYSSGGVFGGNQINDVGLESASSTFIAFDLCNPSYITTLAVDNTTTPDEFGNVITLPYRCVISGVSVIGDLDGACNILLYGTTTKTYSHVANRRYNANINHLQFLFSSSYTAEVNETIRLSVLPTSATSSGMRDYTYPTSYETIAKNLIFGNITISKTSRKSAGAWTDDSTKVVGIWPIISQIEIPPYSSQVCLMGG
jgi:hypothetical protein